MWNPGRTDRRDHVPQPQGWAVARPLAVRPAPALRTVGRNRGDSRNGTSPKGLRTEVGEVDLAVPRDRNGTLEPQIVPDHQCRLPLDNGDAAIGDDGERDGVEVDLGVEDDDGGS